jgi:hypothetical protein
VIRPVGLAAKASTSAAVARDESKGDIDGGLGQRAAEQRAEQMIR